MKPAWPGSALLVAALLGCSPQSAPAEHHGHEPPASAAASSLEAHQDEVRLTPEALELAQISVGRAERRALTGGAAIPAEVQFEPSSTAHVGPMVSGRITKVSATLGDRVRRGQALAVIASSDVSAARARLGQARARLAAAEATYRRQQQLSSEGIGAQRSLIDAEAQVAELRAEVDGVRRQLSVFGAGGAGELTLSAPIDGVVVAVHATLGETLSPEEPAFIITDPTKVWVRGNVPELELAQLRLNLEQPTSLPELPLAVVLTDAPGSCPHNAPLDAVFSNAALHWMLDGEAVLAGVRRALRPGGRFVGEFGGAGNIAAITAALNAERARRGLPAVMPWFNPGPEEYTAMLQAQGFQVPVMELIPRPTPLPGSVRDWLATFAGAFAEGLAPVAVGGFFDAATAALQPMLQGPDGTWTVDYVRLRFAARLP